MGAPAIVIPLPGAKSPYPNAAVPLWEAKGGLPHWVKVEVLHLGAFGVPILPALPVLV